MAITINVTDVHPETLERTTRVVTLRGEIANLVSWYESTSALINREFINSMTLDEVPGVERIRERYMDGIITLDEVVKYVLDTIVENN